MASSVESRLGLWKRVPGMAKLVMLAEAFVITFLSAWLYQEYVSNRYMQAYLNNFVQSDAGAMAILGGVVAVVGLATVGLLYRARSAGKVEPVPTETSIAVPFSTVNPTVPQGESPTVAREVSPVASEHLHPVVAALKAEIAGRPIVTAETFQGLKPQEPTVAKETQTLNGPTPESAGLVVTGIAPVVKKAEAANQTGEKTGSQ